METIETQSPEENPQNTGAIRNEKGQFVPGVSGNPRGKPPGSVSIVAKIKRKFEEDPEYFDEWVEELLKDAGNRRAIMEQIDGKPKQSMDLDVTFPQTLIDMIKHGTSN